MQIEVNRNWIIFFGLFLSLFSPLGIDLYISTIPIISSEYKENAELTLSTYLLFLGVGHILMGWFYDKYGLTKTLFLSMSGFGITSLLIFLSSTFFELILLRSFQGFFVSGIALSSLLVFKDNFEEKETAKFYGYINSIMNIIPTTVPFLGLYLFNITNDWKYSFLVLFVLSFVSMPLIYLSTKKIKKRKSEKLDLSFLKNKTYLKYASSSILSLTILLIYVTISASLFVDKYNWTLFEYSIFFAINGFFLALGGIIFGKLIKSFELLYLLKKSQYIMLISVLFLFLYNIHFYFFILGIFIFSLSFATMIASTTALSTTELNKSSGKALSIISSLQMIFSGFLSYVVVSIGNIINVEVSFSIIILTSCIITLFLTKKDF